MAGTFNFSMTIAINSVYSLCSPTVIPYTLTIYPPCSAIGLTGLPSEDTAVVGAPYAEQIFVVPSGNYTASVIRGALPPGLTIDSSTWVISGTPTQAGMYNFTLSATTSTGCSGARSYSIRVTTRDAEFLKSSSHNVAGDFDGDGKTDFSVFNASENLLTIINSSDGIRREIKVSETSNANVAFAPGDFDGDGKADVAFFSCCTRSGQLTEKR